VDLAPTVQEQFLITLPQEIQSNIQRAVKEL
jgi:hypothetical protein